MVKFLWLSIKPESYFLLVNYVSSTLPIVWLAVPVIRLRNETNFVSEDSLLAINIVFTVTLLLANLGIFLHYSVKNNLFSRFIKFYVYIQLINVFLLLLSTLSLIGYEIGFKEQRSYPCIALLTVFSLFILFLGYCSYKLKGLVVSMIEPDLEEELEKENRGMDEGELGNETETEQVSHPIDQDLENQVNNDSY